MNFPIPVKPKHVKPVDLPGDVIPSPQALEAICRGFEQMADLIAITLGPLQGVIVNASTGKSAPELLTESGVIARRVVQLPERSEDPGAMLLRNLVMKMHENYGDGAATASVIASHLVKRGRILITAGHNPMLLREGIDRGIQTAIKALRAQAQPLRGQTLLARLAEGVTGDPELSQILGEIFDILGQHAAVSIEEFYSPYLEREYLDGGRWTGRPAGRAFIPDGMPLVSLDHPVIIVVDQTLETIDHVRSLLEISSSLSGKNPVLLVAKEIKGEALTTLMLNHNQGIVNMGAVIPAANLISMSDELDDLALMTGATVLSEAHGHPVQSIQISDIGNARTATYTREQITIIGGEGSQPAIQKRVSELRAQMRSYDRSSSDWERLRMRAGRLSGGVGILKIGARYEKERTIRKEAATKAVRMLDLAIEDGIVPGGGVALLNCQQSVLELARQTDTEDEDIRRGIEMVSQALEAPFRQLVMNNKQFSPGVAINQVRQEGTGIGFDVRSGNYVNMIEAGVIDCVRILEGALQTAASGAGMLLTTGTIVLKPQRTPKPQKKPRLPTF